MSEPDRATARTSPDGDAEERAGERVQRGVDQARRDDDRAGDRDDRAAEHGQPTTVVEGVRGAARAERTDGGARANDVAEAKPLRASEPRRSLSATVRKRWRAWLRAIHRDFGYIAIGFTVIYAISGIAMNHIDQWDPNFHSSEYTVQITPIPDDLSDDAAVERVTAATGMGKPDDVYRAGDEVRLGYSDGSKVTAIGDTVTVQKRSSRFFFRVAVWLHAARGKPAWRYISDVYAVLLLYLAISGLFMIKGRLGLRWRGTVLVAVGLVAPVAYILLSGGPDARPDTRDAKDTKADRPSDGIRPLPPDDN